MQGPGSVAGKDTWDRHLQEGRRSTDTRQVTLRDLALRDLALSTASALRHLQPPDLNLRHLNLRDLRLPTLSLPADQIRQYVRPAANPRTALAVAAVGGLALAAVGTSAVRRRRRNVDTGHSDLHGVQQGGLLPTLANYPGPDHRWDRIVVGVLADGTTADIRVGYTPHVLLTGAVGTGKSVVARNILLHALVHADDWNVVAIDPWRVELGQYAAYDNVRVHTSLEAAVIALASVTRDMQHRYELMEHAGVNHFRDLPAPPTATLVYLDEAAFLSPEKAHDEAGETANFLRSEALHMLGSIARLGRAAGVHLVLATQRPDLPVLTEELRANLDLHITMGSRPDQPGRRTVRGRGHLDLLGRVEEFQSYYAPQNWFDDHLNTIALREQSTYHPIPLLRTPSGVVISTDPNATHTVSTAVERLDATSELDAVVARTSAQIKQAVRRGADVIGFVGSLDDAKVLDRIVWAGTVGCVVVVAAPDHNFDALAARLHVKAQAREVGCEIVHDA